MARWIRLSDVVDEVVGVNRRCRGIESTNFYYRIDVDASRILDGDIRAAYSADLLAEERTQRKIRTPFEHQGRLWTNIGGSFGGRRPPQASAWALCPLKLWPGRTFTADQLYRMWNAYERPRGDNTGRIVEFRGQKYVMSEMAIFTGIETPVAKKGQLDLFEDLAA